MRPIFLLIAILFITNYIIGQAPGCPYVDAGSDQILDCVPCTDLTATFHETGLTDQYIVTSVPYNPPFPFSGGTQIPITSDDDWSDVINIPFDFCFYNQMYNQLIIGDNGVISFDLTDANGYCPYSFSNPIPYDFGSIMNIFGAYHDTYLPGGGSMWYSLEGTAPCRMFVFKFDNVAQFSCNNLTTTQQIILYETTNVIEIYIESKPMCSGWNSGNAIVGIQNMTQTNALAAPGRNTSPWTGTQEAWRFTPDGAPNYAINWYENGNLIGTGDLINVCPSTTTTYTAEAVYDHCNGASQVVVTDDVTVTVQSSLLADAGPDQNICPGGTVNLGGNPTAANGTPPYTYSWSSAPAGFTSTLANETVSPTATTTYTVTVSDNGGCIVSDVVTITVTSPAVDNSLTTPDTCGNNDGTITITGTGGYGAPFTYDIGSGAQASGSFTGLTAGPYTITITDAGGCTVTETITVTGTGTALSGFTASNDQCLNNNSFNFTNTGDTGGAITWNWSFPGGTPTTSSDEDPTGISWNTPGQYTVTQTTSIGSCTDVSTYTIEVFEHPTVNVIGVDITCNGAADGSATATGNGGAGNYNYLWTGGLTGSTISNLSANTYNVTVADGNGCTGTGSGTVNENPPIVINTQTSTDVSCFGASDGTVNVTASGGCAPLSYAIPSLINQTGSFINLSGNSYVVTITDCNGCTLTSNNLIINQPPEISVDSYQTTDVSCYHYNDGSFTIAASGGAGGLEYSINGLSFQSSGTFSNLAAGNYTCTILDMNGCSTTQNFSITEPQAITISTSQDQTICDGESANISVSIVGGTAPYSYVWSHMGSIPNGTIAVSPLQNTTYSVYVEDANGCLSNNSETTIYVAPPIELNATSNYTEVCPGDEVIISVTPAAGIGAPYQVFLDGIMDNAPFYVYPMTTTTYTVSAQDLCGSTASVEVPITVHPLPSVMFQPDTTSGCQPLSVNFISLYTAESYVWNFGDNDYNNLSYTESPQHIYEEAGLYSITLEVTSEYGCKNSKTIADLIHVWEVPDAKFIAEPEVASVVKPIIYFTNMSQLADTSYWSFGDGDSSNAYNPHHIYPIYPTGSYNVQLVVSSDKGCRDTTYNDIIIKNEYTFFAPSAFSPDNDGINDEFRVFGNGIDEREFQIYVYDRWGEIVFESKSIDNHWDGRINGKIKAKPGTYTWLVIYKDLQNIEHEETGAVTIIR